MVDVTLAVLERYVAAEITWRAACRELGLWSYDDLLELLAQKQLAIPMPLREDVQGVIAGRVMATLDNKSD